MSSSPPDRDSPSTAAGTSRPPATPELCAAAVSITVSGTTANDGRSAALYLGDTEAQTVAALRQALAAVERLGGQAPSTWCGPRIFLAPGADWQAASAAHAEASGTVSPANTMLFVHALIGEAFLVEVEVDSPCRRGGSSGVTAPEWTTSLRLNNDVPIDEFVESALLAESLQFDQIWVSTHLFFRSAPVVLAAAATATRKIALGTCILNPYSMHPWWRSPWWRPRCRSSARAASSSGSAAGAEDFLGLGGRGPRGPAWLCMCESVLAIRARAPASPLPTFPAVARAGARDAHGSASRRSLAPPSTSGRCRRACWH